MTTIGVDIRVLGTGRTSGIEEYTDQLLAHLIPLDPSIHYKLFFAGRRPLDIARGKPWIDAPNVTLYDTRRSNRWLWARTRLTGRPYLDQLVGGTDIFFFPHFLAGATSPHTRRVLTIHDLSFERFPEFFSRRSLWWHRFQMRPRVQAHAADRIIAVSESTRRDLISLYGIDAERIATVHSGVNPALIRPSDHAIAEFRVLHRLPERYVLMLGARDPRKNARGIAAAAHAVGVPLITHEIPDHERSLWLSAATAVVYASFFEGFGFPPLEAMACGTPVIAAANSSVLEISGEGALMVNPYSVSEISHALESVLNDRALRDSLVRRGLRVAQQYSWQVSAENTLSTLLGAVQ